MKVSEVFTPGKMPTITYVGDHIAKKATIFQDTIDAGGSLISISGPSKSGKTVFVEQIVGADNIISVTGAGIQSANELWNRVFDIIGTPVGVKNTSENVSQSKIAAKAGGGIPFALSAEAATETMRGTRQLDESVTAIDYLATLIKELRDTDYVLFIDDFHYIKKEAQIIIAQQLKEAIRNNVKIVCASVPYHSDDSLRANPDLQGRIIGIDFSYWPATELRKIAKLGFDHMKMNLEEELLLKIVNESAGSPQLMQSLCLNFCYEHQVREVPISAVNYSYNQSLFERVCSRVSMSTDFSTIIQKMKEGPKVRGSERKQYLAISGTIVDVYPLILSALKLDPPCLTFNYSEMQSRIKIICPTDGPVGSSVLGACSHISQIANGINGKTIIEWDSEHDVLDIRDPSLLFYIRWAE